MEEKGRRWEAKEGKREGEREEGRIDEGHEKIVPLFLKFLDPPSDPLRPS